MAAKMIVFAACFAAPALSQYAAAPGHPAPKAYAPEPAHAPAPYSFEYSVNDPHTNDVHSRSEHSDGNGNVKGTYSLVEADGSTRVVDYTAGKDGFNADVKKIEGSGHKYGAPPSAPYEAQYGAPPSAPHEAQYGAPSSAPHETSYGAPSAPRETPVYEPAPYEAY